MQKLLISINTSGDIEQFLPQAEILTQAGHETSCPFPTQPQIITIEADQDTLINPLTH